jgi:DNA adenine methylase
MKTYLKWAGGKTKVVDKLLSLFPQKINKYIEPFVGSASVFLNVIDSIQKDTDKDIYSEKILPKAFYLNDFNYFLINCHQIVSDKVEEVILDLEELQKEFIKNKDKRLFFNRKREEMNRLIIKNILSENEKKRMFVLFICLNKTCFNGLWRVNKKGLFNVPWNQVETTNLYNSETLKECSYLLKKSVFFNQDFEIFIKDNVKKNDFVFLDPPYVPVSITSSFTSYTENEWTSEEDNRLADCLEYIDSIGAKFMMTNSNSEKVENLFGKWNFLYMDVHRFIKTVKAKNQEKRSKVKETIIMNY